jgi:hypothetical protein
VKSSVWKSSWWCMRFLASFFVLFLVEFSLAQSKPKPGKDYVWVPQHQTQRGILVPGHWRLKTRKGFVWIKGHANEKGDWIPGHWKPVGPSPKGKVWVPGHVGEEGDWIPGHWRLAKRAGFIWVAGHYNNKGVWIAGHWKRME